MCQFFIGVVGLGECARRKPMSSIIRGNDVVACFGKRSDDVWELVRGLRKVVDKQDRPPLLFHWQSLHFVGADVWVFLLKPYLAMRHFKRLRGCQGELAFHMLWEATRWMRDTKKTKENFVPTAAFQSVYPLYGRLPLCVSAQHSYIKRDSNSRFFGASAIWAWDPR